MFEKLGKGFYGRVRGFFVHTKNPNKRSSYGYQDYPNWRNLIPRDLALDCECGRRWITNWGIQKCRHSHPEGVGRYYYSVLPNGNLKAEERYIAVNYSNDPIISDTDYGSVYNNSNSDQRATPQTPSPSLFSTGKGAFGVDEIVDMKTGRVGTSHTNIFDSKETIMNGKTYVTNKVWPGVEETISSDGEVYTTSDDLIGGGKTTVSSSGAVYHQNGSSIRKQ